MSRRKLTTTSYAILGLLDIRPWATYELAGQMRRSLHWFWPRAESNLYAEPKRLAEAGLAEASEEWNGDRKRTVYSITDRGRRELERWLGTAAASERFESEACIRVSLGNRGTKEDLLRAIQRIEDDAAATLANYVRYGREYARGEGLFPQRIHVNALIASLLIAQARASGQWARWAKAEIERWEGTAMPDVEWAVRTLNEAIGDERG